MESWSLTTGGRWFPMSRWSLISGRRSLMDRGWSLMAGRWSPREGRWSLMCTWSFTTGGSQSLMRRRSLMGEGRGPPRSAQTQARKYARAKVRTLRSKAGDEMRVVGVKKGFSMTRRYTS
jgi:hypothetical protein